MNHGDEQRRHGCSKQRNCSGRRVLCWETPKGTHFDVLILRHGQSCFSIILISPCFHAWAWSGLHLMAQSKGLMIACNGRPSTRRNTCRGMKEPVSLTSFPHLPTLHPSLRVRCRTILLASARSSDDSRTLGQMEARYTVQWDCIIYILINSHANSGTTQPLSADI